MNHEQAYQSALTGLAAMTRILSDFAKLAEADPEKRAVLRNLIGPQLTLLREVTDIAIAAMGVDETDN